MSDEPSATVALAFTTVKAVDVAAPPPGAGFVTTIVAVPTEAVSVVFNTIESCVDDAIVGVLLAPLNVTVVAAVKPVPATVNVGVAPYVVDDGAIVEIVGVGYFTKIVGCDAISASVPVTAVREVVVAV